MNPVAIYGTREADSIFELPLTQKVNQTSPFKLQVINTSTDEQTREALIKEIKTVIDVWLEILTLRDDGTQVISICRDLLKSLKEKIQVIDPNKHIMILHDTTNRIQGLAYAIVRSSYVWLDTLITAPWNLQAGAPNLPEHTEFVVRGVGTTLVRQVYELAQLTHKDLITLLCSDEAIDFYRKLKFQRPWSGGCDYYLTVAPDSVPKELQVTSGNLLPSSGVELEYDLPQSSACSSFWNRLCCPSPLQSCSVPGDAEGYDSLEEVISDW